MNGDLVDELNETFDVDLADPTNATISDGHGVVTINDDDPQPVVSIDDVSHAEGDAGTTTFDFTVSLSRPSSRTVSVDFATADGTATSPSDYGTSTGTITFAPGDLTATTSVDVSGDTTAESDETFTVVLSDPVRATLGDASGTGTIVNDDSQASLAIDDVTHAEGDFGQTSYSFTVTLSGPLAVVATVAYETVDATATAPSDYDQQSGQLIFLPGETSQDVSVDVNGDLTYENDESFAVELSGAIGAVIIDDTGVGTIMEMTTRSRQCRSVTSRTTRATPARPAMCSR